VPLKSCPVCGGTGWFEDALHAGQPCPFCNGKGVFEVEGGQVKIAIINNVEGKPLLVGERWGVDGVRVTVLTKHPDGGAYVTVPELRCWFDQLMDSEGAP
jgi:DnaJ-class molecular chaperone